MTDINKIKWNKVQVYFLTCYCLFACKVDKSYLSTLHANDANKLYFNWCNVFFFKNDDILWTLNKLKSKTVYGVLICIFVTTLLYYRLVAAYW